MSEPLKSIHVRLSPEAHKALAMIADTEDKDNAEMARLILEESLLGRIHVLMLTAKRYQGAGSSGILGFYNPRPWIMELLIPSEPQAGTGGAIFNALMAFYPTVGAMRNAIAAEWASGEYYGLRLAAAERLLARNRESGAA